MVSKSLSQTISLQMGHEMWSQAVPIREYGIVKMPAPFLRRSIRFAVSIMHGESMHYTAMTEIYFFKKVRELMTFLENKELSFVSTSKIGGGEVL